jgi:ferritin-like metal-binding protein YciE
LTEVLKDGLKDIYYAEKQLVKALKKVSKAATNQELKMAFDTHRAQTEEQVQKLEGAFEELGMRASGKNCPAMDGLIEEANEHIEEMDKGPALDAALIVGAQKIEHYEIAAYGSMRTFAKSLGYTECERIFEEILEQESDTDELLTEVARTVNMEALREEGGGANGSTGNSNGSSRASKDGQEVGEMEEQQM